MLLLQKNYKNCRLNTKNFVVQGTGSKINGVYYYIVTDPERQKISGELKNHLNLK